MLKENQKENTDTSIYRHLLIVGCSQRKRQDAGLLPAIERYDGPTFRLLRRFLRQQKSKSREISVFILSAEFGLIPDNELIPYYDRRMTAERSRQLQPGVIAELRHILNARPYQELCICVGRDYFRALEGYQIQVPSGLTVRTATGAAGKKLSQLYEWLYGKQPIVDHFPSANVPKGKARLRGIEILLTPTQIISLARRALAESKGDSSSYKSWYVLVDDRRVAPKWLVSQLTGLPVATFTAGEARQVLSRLGIQVHQLVVENVNEIKND